MEEKGREQVPVVVTVWRLPSTQLCIPLDMMGVKSTFQAAVGQYLKICLCKYQELSEPHSRKPYPQHTSRSVVPAQNNKSASWKALLKPGSNVSLPSACAHEG